jgi:hypothetical protein
MLLSNAVIWALGSKGKRVLLGHGIGQGNIKVFISSEYSVLSEVIRSDCDFVEVRHGK